MTKAPFVFDHTTKNSPLEGVTITAGAQAPSGSRARRPADEATPSRAATRSPFPLPSNAERLEYEPATQLPQSGLVQWAISVAIGHYLDALETSSKTSVGSDILSSPRSSGPSLAERLSLLVLRGFIDRNRISEMSRR